MRVVLFCGGMGTRIRDESDSVPKPMVTVGPRPILWHIMRYYAHFGHKDFILCLGYRAEAIKQYFLEYDETVSNDFVLSGGGKQITLIGRDIDDWRITFVDTGMSANIGQRLRAVAGLVEGEEMFLANYADGVTSLPLPSMLERFQQSSAVASFLAVQPTSSFHVVQNDEEGVVTSIRHIRDSGLRINGGYFAMRPEIFKYLHPGEELVEEPFQRLIAERKLLAHAYDGFWACMDTFKERQALQERYSRGDVPWMLWRKVNGNGHGHDDGTK